METHVEITEKDREVGLVGMNCNVCTTAHRKQKGLAYLFVKNVKRGFCPYCQAYERVYGRKAHEEVQV